MTEKLRIIIGLGLILLGSQDLRGESNSWNGNDSWLSRPVWNDLTNSDLVVRGNGSCEAAGCSTCNECADCNDAGCPGDWRDNTVIFAGGDTYAGLGEFPTGGYNNSFGLVSGFNTGFGLGDFSVRGQFGASYGAYDFKGRTLSGQNSSVEDQIYITSGLYRRADLSYDEQLSWGMVVDGLISDNWGIQGHEVELAQFRGLTGWALNEYNEVGIWGTLNLSNDFAPIFGRNPIVRAMKQTNLYWRHNWDFGASTMFYLGALDSADVGDWLFGMNGQSPLNDWASLYGGFTYVTPSSSSGPQGDEEEVWNANFGIAFFLGGKSVSRQVTGDAGLPLIPVANNSSFLITD